MAVNQNSHSQPVMAESSSMEEPFDFFFNNESLSDRILKIVEIEEVYLGNANCDVVPDQQPSKKPRTLSQNEVNLTTTQCKQEEEENEEKGTSKDIDVKNQPDLYPNHNEQLVESIDSQEEGVAEIITLDADVVSVEPNGTFGNVLEEEASVQIDVEENNIVVNQQQKQLIQLKSENGDKVVHIKHQGTSGSETGALENDVSFVNLADITTLSSNNTKMSDIYAYEITTNNNTSSHSPQCTSKGKKRKATQVNSSSSTSELFKRNVIKEVKVFIHSVILAAKSTYFRCLFSCGMRETNEKEIKIEVQKGEIDDMMILLHCFYNKKYVQNQPLATVSNVCNLAMRFCFDGLITTCLEILCDRAKTVTTICDINIIIGLATRIQSQLPPYKEKCLQVTKACTPTLLQHFLPMDETLEKTPTKFYSLPLNTMYLFLEEESQKSINEKHGNLFVYCIQQWLKFHSRLCKNEETVDTRPEFIRKFTEVIDINFITGDFLTNIMTYEHSPLNIWSGYKEWYIKALQNHVFKSNSLDYNPPQHNFQSILKRRRISRFVRNDNNADIFALQHPVILNGFEVSVYLRIRNDFKMHIICKCKNILVNKKGFGKSSLVFNLRGSVKLNINSNIWIESFPTSHEWLSFSYKTNNSMFAEMYPVCKLRPDVYNLAKTYGFILTFQMQQIN